MAKSKAEWKAWLVGAKNADPLIGTGGVSELTSDSAVSIWGRWLEIIAGALFDLGNLFDFHKAEVADLIKRDKSHRVAWYAGKAKAYQHGDSLPADTDTYDPVRVAGDAALVVKFASAVELGNRIRIKMAKGTPGALVPLSGGELTGSTAYLNRVKDAGVRLDCTSGVADTLQPTMVIWYDPLVLDATGARLDGTAAAPVKDAVNSFLAGIDFDTRFILDKYIAAMSAVEGVKVAEVTSVRAYYGAVTPVVITNWYEPDAGYLALDETWFGSHVSYSAY